MRSSNLITRILALTVALATMLGGVNLAAAQGGTKFTATALTPESTVSASGIDDKDSVAAVTNGAGMASVFIKLNKPSLASRFGGNVSLTSPEAVAYLAELSADLDVLEARVKSKLGGTTITHRFDVILGGLAVLAPAAQLDQLKGIPGVERVLLDKVEKIETYRSTTFIGANSAWQALGGQGKAGEGVIVGVLDSGVWPELASFSDPDPLGKAYAAPPPAPGNPGGARSCNFGSAVTGDAPFACNNKLIGAYRFMSTYGAVVGLQPYEFRSGRDDDGHGSHTSSTAAGNRGVRAATLNASETITGVAPRAHVISYKVCGELGCFGTDSAAAVQQAIRDGANSLNFSISGGSNPYGDVVSLAFLDAYNAGIFVAASAGNSGPAADTTDHREPWVMTVAASSSDRAYLSTATLTAPGGATLVLQGATITDGISTPTPVVINSADPLCLSPADPGSFAGQIVICRRGVIARTEKGANVLAGGAAGMFLYNPAPQGENDDSHVLPTVHFEANEGTTLVNFVTANPGTTATFTDGTPGSIQGDVMAGFSSRGGPGQNLGISKPDVTAPGINIFAGYTALAYGTPVDPYAFVSGTSMSGPHVAGAGAIVKALHPTWTPGQIKSALMMTAKDTGVVKEDTVTPATPFDMGSGRINLRKVIDVGLSISASGADFVNQADSLWNTNYPSIYIPSMPGRVTVQRTVQELTGYDTQYHTRVRAPRDVRISVPSGFFIYANSTQTLDITIDARDVPVGEVRHATVYLYDAWHTLHIPVTIVRQQPNITMSKTCDSASLRLNDTMSCSITMANGTFDTAQVDMADVLPSNLTLVPGSVVGGTEDGNTVRFSGALTGYQPPTVAIGATNDSPAGYLPLSTFGITPIAGVGDETASTFTVPGFRYGGETYSRISMISNGYAVVGGISGAADIQFINQSLPSGQRPDNVLAPFWTDLNPADGGAMRAGILTDGTRFWLVLEWEGVREFSSDNTASFQIWLQLGATEDTTFTYGTITGNGDGGFLTVGAENRFGNRGANYYVDGVGTLPAADTQLRVTTEPAAPAQPLTVTFRVKGCTVGRWTNYAEMTSPAFFGTSITSFSGRVVR